jgi:hypothetical protein
LSFLHTHTCETLAMTYFQERNYFAPSLERANQLLRIFAPEKCTQWILYCSTFCSLCKPKRLTTASSR